MRDPLHNPGTGTHWRTAFAAAVLSAGLGAGAGRADWKEWVGETAERGPGGVLKKVWVVRNEAPVFDEPSAEKVVSRLRQHAKAYHFGSFDPGVIAIGDAPKREDCRHGGFIRTADVIVWDTDQALRFVGKQQDRNVELFRDEQLTDKVGDATVEGPSDPTVMPFPIFRRTDDGRAFEIAFIYTAASGADTYDQRVQESLRKVITKDVSSIDVVFVMDVTGSMANVLEEAKERVRGIMEEFNGRKVELFGQLQPLRMRFAFVGYRDKKEGDQWVEIIPFAARGQTEAFEQELESVRARTVLNDDWPEDVCAGLEEALALDWKQEHAKAMVLLGDAPPLDQVACTAVVKACQERFIRIYTIPIESMAGPFNPTLKVFQRLALATGGQCFESSMQDDAATVDRIIESLTIEEAAAAKAPEVVRSWAEQGATLSRDIQEFRFRGILPDDEQRPIPPTVYVSSRQDGSRQVCLFKSRTTLYEMLGDMQTDFVGMIENPSPELMAAINAGGVEFIAELDPKVLQSIVNMNDPGDASAEIRRMLSVMPELPGIVRELNEKGLAAEWHELARKTATLSRFVSDPNHFYEGRAWVPFDVLEVGEGEGKSE